MDFAQYILNIPLLHSWDGGNTWNSGGFEKFHLKAFYSLINEISNPDITILETGAGNSTLTFLLSNPGKLISIAKDGIIFERIFQFIKDNKINDKPLKAIVERSEWALPELAQSGLSIDLALIDGGHNWPTVFVDFCYIYYMLNVNGYLIIDDVHLHSIKELARLLYADKKRFDLKSDLGKALVFQKITEEKYLPEWPDEPYIKEQTDIYLSSSEPNTLGTVKTIMWYKTIKRDIKKLIMKK